jgi:hypothetical protein
MNKAYSWSVNTHPVRMRDERPGCLRDRRDDDLREQRSSRERWSRCIGTRTTCVPSRSAASLLKHWPATWKPSGNGILPHGGFAIGLERWVAQLVGAPNIRAVTAFPRDMSRLIP